MKKKMFCILAVIAVFLIAGCDPMQQPTDVSYIPIDEIQVEDNISEPGISEFPPAPRDEITEDEPEEEQQTEFPPFPEEDGAPEAEEITEDEMGEEPETQQPNEIVIIVEETELVSLQPVAQDPDEDTLDFTYSSPLNEQGQWQTDYGDAGQYTVTITASDGELTTSRDALLIVNKREEPPTIDSRVPEEMEQIISENTELEFNVEASDPNDDELSYQWKLDGNVVSAGSSYTYVADYNSAGSHTIKADISDSTETVSLLWSVTVNNVNRPPILKVIPDITVRESETITIQPDATDPDGDELAYTISEPVGDDGEWQTSYDDAGVYRVDVAASDGDMEDTQTVEVTVINVNRPPVIDDIVQVE
ncbi:hypothetical protein GF323_05230 [Candidatus Woesearchaeota archaeon]|nr:hypothetical protein [Candidatus Woesearchaeota archaeon]